MVCSCYHFYDLYKRFPRGWEEAREHQWKLEALADAGAINAMEKGATP
jgi:hypothetical protein